MANAVRPRYTVTAITWGNHLGEHCDAYRMITARAIAADWLEHYPNYREVEVRRWGGGPIVATIGRNPS